MIAAVLGLYLLNSYIYFGRHPFWAYVTAVAQPLLHPLRTLPLRFSRLDFAPVVAMVLVLFAAQTLERWMNLFGRAHLPGSRDLYVRLPL